MITRPCPSCWTHGSPLPRRAWSGRACAWTLGTTMRRPRSGSPRPDYTPHIRRRGEASPAHDPRVEPRRWPVERTHAWHNRFRRLLSAWCLVGDLGVIFLLVSGRWANDWVGFVAGGFGALFL